MSAPRHAKPEPSEPTENVTHFTYDARGHIGDAQRVVITKPVRNWFAFFALAGSLVSFLIFNWFVLVLVGIAAYFGFHTASAVREGKYCSIAATVLLVISIVVHAL